MTKYRSKGHLKVTSVDSVNGIDDEDNAVHESQKYHDLLQPGVRNEGSLQYVIDKARNRSMEYCNHPDDLDTGEGKITFMQNIHLSANPHEIYHLTCEIIQGTCNMN